MERDPNLNRIDGPVSAARQGVVELKNSQQEEAYKSEGWPEAMFRFELVGTGGPSSQRGYGTDKSSDGAPVDARHRARSLEAAQTREG